MSDNAAATIGSPLISQKSRLKTQGLGQSFTKPVAETFDDLKLCDLNEIGGKALK